MISLDDIIAAAEAVQYGNKGGPERGTYCPSGRHLMAEDGRQQWKTGPSGVRIRNGRYCLACKRERDTPAARERYRKKKGMTP